MQDIRGSKKLMGGMTVLNPGNFRQTLHIVRRGKRDNEINARLNISFLWPSFNVLKLTKNMRTWKQSFLVVNF